MRLSLASFAQMIVYTKSSVSSSIFDIYKILIKLLYLHKNIPSSFDFYILKIKDKKIFLFLALLFMGFCIKRFQRCLNLFLALVFFPELCIMKVAAAVPEAYFLVFLFHEYGTNKI